MFCKYCGAVLDDDAAFCEKCGKPVSRTAAVPTAGPEVKDAGQAVNDANQTVKDVVPAEKEFAVQSAGQDPEGTAGSEGKGKRKKGSPLLIALICMAVVALAVAACIFGKGETGKPVLDVTAQNNFNNGGIFAYDENRLYFVAPYEGKEAETCLYSTDYDGNDKKKLSDNKKIHKVRVSDGKLLYMTFDKDNDVNTVGMMNPDGSEDTTIVTTADEITAFDKDGDEILYLTNDVLHSCSLQGDHDTIIVSDIESFINAGNTIYYTTDNGVYTLDKKSGKSEKILSGEISEFCVEDGNFYYRKNDTYYRADAQGQETRLYEGALAHYMLIMGDNIYFVRMFNDDELKKHLGDDWFKADTGLYMIGVGVAMKMPKEGGTADVLYENGGESPVMGSVVYGYPGGMYTRLSILLNLMERVTDLPPDVK